MSAAMLERRPLLVVEDHTHHIERVLERIRVEAPALLGRLSVVSLDRPGPDTDTAAARWLALPGLQVVAPVDALVHPRLLTLPQKTFLRASSLTTLLARLLVPGGLLVQDIQLETLAFIAKDDWWESIYLANTVRGMFGAPQLPPQVLFMSNKRGFQVDFGKNMMEAGFDPHDVLAKDELDEALVPLLRRRLRAAFPLRLRATRAPEPEWVPDDPASLAALGARFDVVLSDLRGTRLGLAGAALKKPASVAKDGSEAQTWRALAEAHVRGLPGPTTRAVGERVAPDQALPAEQSNAAARHVYALRKRLEHSEALITQDGRYALAPGLRVAYLEPRPRL